MEGLAHQQEAFRKNLACDRGCMSNSAQQAFFLLIEVLLFCVKNKNQTTNNDKILPL